jgi:hypothetical protein
MSLKSAANVTNEDRVIFSQIAKLSIADISSKHENSNNCQTCQIRFGCPPTSAVINISHYSIQILCTLLGVSDFY